MRKIKYLTDKETEELIDSVAFHSYCSQRDSAIITLLLNTGLKVSELRGLDVADVKNGTLRDELTIRTKDRKERTIPLNQKAKRSITEIIEFNQAKGYDTDNSDPLIWSRNHRRISVRRIQQILKELSDRLKYQYGETEYYDLIKEKVEWKGGP